MMKRFNVKGDNIVIEAESVEEIKLSYPDGNFYRCPIHPEVYYMQNGKRRWVKTLEVWNKMSADLGIAWEDIEILSVPEWEEFLSAIEEGKAIEDWPEGEFENHHTDKVYRIGHTTSAISRCLHDLWELGFNVIHTNDSRKFSIADFRLWLDKCNEKNMYFLPRITTGQAESILPHIKDDPNLAGVTCWDELDCEHISKDDQQLFAKICEKEAPNVLRFASIDQGDWNKWVDFDSWDIIMASCYPNLEEWQNQAAMNAHLGKIKTILPQNKPFMVILRGYEEKSEGVPNIIEQYRWWNNNIPGGMNSYAIYLHGAGNEATGFAERDDMKEQVKKLNKEIR